jgi:hypothetical protein
MGLTHYEHGPGCECVDCRFAYHTSAPEEALTRIRQWQSRTQTPMPEWWDWAVAVAQYHLPMCDWVKVGVSTNHCSCALTRVIAKIIDEAKR